MAPSWYDPAHLPRFAHPPVVETAMGLEFAPLAGLGFINLTRLQAEWSDRYPNVIEMAGMPPSSIDLAPQQFTFVPGLPIARIWAEGLSDGLLVQTQNDRLILNWRKAFSEAPYPGYSALRPKYESLLHEFAAFVAANSLGEIVPGTAEYTYVNNVSLAPGESFEDVLSVFSRPDRALPGTPATTRFQFIRTVDQSEDPSGDPFSAQIFVVGEPQSVDGQNVLTMNVTARVLFSTGGDPMAALDAAHALSSHTFANITAEAKHAEWESLR